MIVLDFSMQKHELAQYKNVQASLDALFIQINMLITKVIPRANSLPLFFKR